MLTHKQHIIIYLRRYQFIEVLQEWSDFNIRVSTITWHGPHFNVCLMKSLQIFALFTATYHNHRIVMTCQNEVYH